MADSPGPGGTPERVADAENHEEDLSLPVLASSSFLAPAATPPRQPKRGGFEFTPMLRSIARDKRRAIHSSPRRSSKAAAKLHGLLRLQERDSNVVHGDEANSRGLLSFEAADSTFDLEGPAVAIPPAANDVDESVEPAELSEPTIGHEAPPNANSRGGSRPQTPTFRATQQTQTDTPDTPASAMNTALHATAEAQQPTETAQTDAALAGADGPMPGPADVTNFDVPEPRATRAPSRDAAAHVRRVFQDALHRSPRRATTGSAGSAGSGEFTAVPTPGARFGAWPAAPAEAESRPSLPVRQESAEIERLRSEVYSLQLKLKKLMEENHPEPAPPTSAATTSAPQAHAPTAPRVSSEVNAAGADAEALSALERENSRLVALLESKQAQIDHLEAAAADNNTRALEDENDELRASAQAAVDAVAERDQLLAQRRDIIFDLQERLDASEAANSAAVAAAAKTEANLKLAASKLEAEESARRAVEAVLAEVREELRNERTALASERRAVTVKANEAGRLQIDVESARSQYKLLEAKAAADAESARASLAAARAQEEALRDQVTKRDTELQRLRAEAYSASSELAVAKRDEDKRARDELRQAAEVERLKAALTTARDERDRLADAHRGGAQALSKSQAVAASAAAAEAKLQERVHALEVEVGNAAAAVAAARKDADQQSARRTEDAARAADETERLHARLAEMAGRLTTAQDKLASAEGRAKLAEASLRDAHERGRELTEARNEAQAEATKLRTRARVLEGEKAELEAGRPSSRGDAETTQVAARATASAAAAEAEAERLRRRLADAERDAEDKRAMWKHAVDDLQRDRATRDQQIATLEVQLRQAQSLAAQAGVLAPSAATGPSPAALAEALARERARADGVTNAAQHDAALARAELDEAARQLADARTQAAQFHAGLAEAGVRAQRLEGEVRRVEAVAAERAARAAELEEALRQAAAAADAAQRAAAERVEAAEAAAAARAEAAEARIRAAEAAAAARAESARAAEARASTAAEYGEAADARARTAEAQIAQAQTEARERVAEAERFAREAEARLLAAEAARAAAEASAQNAQAAAAEAAAAHAGAVAPDHARAVAPAAAHTLESLDVVMQYHSAFADRASYIFADLVFWKNFAREAIRRHDEYDAMVLRARGLPGAGKRTFAGVATAVLAAVRFTQRRRPAVPAKLARRYARLVGQH